MKRVGFWGGVIALFLLAGLAHAGGSSRMYRYMDDAGKWVYVATYEDIPPQYKNSASAVLITEKASEQQEEATPPDSGDAVRVVGQMGFSASQSGKSVVSGAAKNFHNTKVVDAKIIVQVRQTDGQDLPPSPFPIAGKGGDGVLEPGETAKIEVTLDVPASQVKGFSYSFSWRTETIKTPEKREGKREEKKK